MGVSAKLRVTEAQFFLHLCLNEALWGSSMALLLMCELVGSVGLLSLRSVVSASSHRGSSEQGFLGPLVLTHQ